MAKENQIAVEVVTKSDSIAGMREEIKGFRKALEEASIAGGDVTEATQKLNAAQNELRNVIKLGTKSVEDADDSYNTLTRTMAQLKEQWRAATDEVKRDELGKQIAGINQRLKDMDASVGDYFRNVGDYRNQIVEAFKDSTDALDHFLPGIGQVGTAMYDVVNAAVSLSSILPVAIKGVKGLVGSLKGVKAAIAATGVGVFVVVLGAIIANWEKIAELWRDTTPEDTARVAIDRLNASLEAQSSILIQKNISALEQYTIALNNAKGDIDAIKAAEEQYNITVLNNRLKIAKTSLAEAYKAERIAYAAYVKKQNDETTEALNAAKDKVSEIRGEIAQIENDIAKANADKLADAQKATTPKSTPTADPEEERLARIEAVGLKEIEIRENVKNHILEGMEDIRAMRDADVAHQQNVSKIEGEIEKRKIAQKRQSVNAMGQILASAAQLIGENTTAGKALAVASTLISTFQSAQLAYQSAFLPVPTVASPALGVLSATAATLAGLANVKQILSVKTDGSQNSLPSGGGVATPTRVATSAVIQQVPVTRSLTSASEEERLNKMASDQRVYVVESDIQEAGRRADVRDKESSF